METQTRFDLNAAITNWQLELAAQPDLTPVVRKELETHLRDTIAELQGRGLNNEEAFWLARRRTGRPQQLGEEFAKGEPANVWRDRLFWVVVGLLYINFWGTLANYPSKMAGPTLYHRLEASLPGIPGRVWFHLPHWLREIQGDDVLGILTTFLHIVPVILLAIFLANRRLKIGQTILDFVVSSRARFIWITLSTFLLVNSFGWLQSGPTYFIFMIQLPWVLSLTALAAWLMKPDKRRNRFATSI